jgi:hypothetical protein
MVQKSGEEQGGMAGEVRAIFELTPRRQGYFSCNPAGEIWVAPCRGYIPKDKRVYVHGVNRLLDRLADRVIRLQETGGRFYLCERGVFFADGDELVLRPTEMARLLPSMRE